ncbi:hypothetical protein ACVWW4_000853 [Bradyrhizobium sp. LB7.1]
MTRKSRGYTGELATPRQPLAPLSLLDPVEEIERRKAAQAEDYEHKLGLLLDHYGIERNAPNAFPQLLQHLLVDHVPGFQTASGPGRGRSAKWTDSMCIELVHAVRSMVESGKALNQESALSKLAEAGRFGSNNTDSLRRRYNEASNSPIVTAYEKLMALADGKLSWSDMPQEMRGK